jgi:hypothetical protein
MVRFCFLAVAALALSACRGSAGPDPDGSVSGTAYGVSFTAESVYTTFGGGLDEPCVITDGGSPPCGPGFLEIWLTNRSDDTCSFLQGESASGTEIVSFASRDALVLDVVNPNGSVTPGTYTIENGDAGSGAEATGAFLWTTDSKCQTLINPSASSGTITVTRASSAGVAGTYSVSFGAEGAFSGQFDVTLCSLPATAAPPTPPTPVCR